MEQRNDVKMIYPNAFSQDLPPEAGEYFCIEKGNGL
jgi:hypothetical protein